MQTASVRWGVGLVCVALVACEGARDPTDGTDVHDTGPHDAPSALLDGGPGGDAGQVDAGGPAAAPLAVLNPHDPARAARGADLLATRWPGAPVLPKVALQNLWAVWGTGPVDEATRWREIERRYGLTRRSGEAWPVGLVDTGGPSLSFDCLLCHASRGAEPGQVWVGVGNARLNLERLYEDLLALNAVAGQLGIGSLPVPYDLEGVSGAPGAVDGVGLGMRFAGTIDDLGETFGHQQAPAWWTMRYKEKLYTDGSGRVDNHRTMMSTLFSFGLTQPQIMGYDADFEDLRHYLLSLEPPPWPYPAPAAEDVEAGFAVFTRACARCHGTYGEGARFPGTITPTAEVGTDPVREGGMDSTQVGIINASWYGQPARWVESDGYLAPPLVGVWATAPYLHNGSVPDLASLLDSSTRPAVWRYADDLAYDPARVGWAYETSGDPASLYDTTKRGLSNAGHTYGDDLSAADRAALLAYLVTL